MRRQSAPALKQHHIAGLDLLHPMAAHFQEITRPDRRHHAGPGGAEAQLSRRTKHLCRQFAARFVTGLIAG